MINEISNETSIEEVLFLICTHVDLDRRMSFNNAEFDRLQNESPEYIRGWKAHVDAIQTEKKRIFRSLKLAGIDVYQKIKGEAECDYCGMSWKKGSRQRHQESCTL
tara:strand:- start:1132 stop:1449 length:318 start_codon:yes stop_codon:yes gene_type:complete